jgi:hypothetical protein
VLVAARPLFKEIKIPNVRAGAHRGKTEPMSGGVPIEPFSFVSSAALLVILIALLTWPGTRHGKVRLSARDIFAVTGLVQAKPDPWLEHKLREKFAEFDRELRRLMPRLYRCDGAE